MNLGTFTPNIIAILAAIVFNMLIGSLWYSPLLFGKKWMKLINFTEKDIENGMSPGIIITAIIIALVEGYFINVLQNAIGITSIMNSLLLGVIVWAGFVATTFLNTILYENKPISLYFLNIGHYLVSFIGMSIIINLFR